jgi:hypothetical protein
VALRHRADLSRLKHTETNSAQIVVVRGKPPAARRGHASAIVSVKAAVAPDDGVDAGLDARQLLVSAGFGHHTRHCDLWRLVFFGDNAPLWERVDVAWKAPVMRVRGYHGVGVCDGKLWIVGGFDDVDLHDTLPVSLNNASDVRGARSVARAVVANANNADQCARCARRIPRLQVSRVISRAAHTLCCAVAHRFEVAAVSQVRAQLLSRLQQDACVPR